MVVLMKMCSTFCLFSGLHRSLTTFLSNLLYSAIDMSPWLKCPWTCTRDHGSDMVRVFGVRDIIWLRRVEPQRPVMLTKVTLRCVGSPISAPSLLNEEWRMITSFLAIRNWVIKRNGVICKNVIECYYQGMFDFTQVCWLPLYLRHPDLGLIHRRRRVLE